MFGGVVMNKIVIVLMILLVFSATAMAVPSDKEEFTFVNVVVRKGDTIWDLSKSFAAKNEDVRIVVDRIYKVNKIQDSSIRPGQSLVVPVQKEHAKSLGQKL